MTYLEMCQRLRLEAGIAGSGPTSVVSQTGELGRIVDWVATANDDIQNSNATWRFLQTSFDFSTVASIQNYAPADVSITDLASWKFGRSDDFTVYSSVADEQYLIYVPWNDFKGSYLFGTSRSQTDKPTIVTIKPDNSMSFYATPDAVYTVTGEYYKKAEELTADADESLIPSQFHMIVVWRALMLYGAYSGAADAFTHGSNEYNTLLRKLNKSELPRMTWGSPLA